MKIFFKHNSALVKLFLKKIEIIFKKSHTHTNFVCVYEKIGKRNSKINYKT
jgi:hypothetical protein